MSKPLAIGLFAGLIYALAAIMFVDHLTHLLVYL
jgi:hypothetical protein